MGFEQVAIDDILAEVREFGVAIQKFTDQAKTILVPAWVVPAPRPYGLLDMKPGLGIAHTLMRMNLALAETLESNSIHILHTERWLGGGSTEAFSAKRWYMGKLPFSNQVFREAARDIKAALRGIYGQGKKLIIVDLDETLWGGIVGDDGWENLQLGGHDAAGEAFVDFQQALKALMRRGVLLGIVSKNTESIALEAIQRHPEMVLRLDDFAGWRINWDDKARNVADLVDELNLGLQSVVFIDDDPVERARLREALPDVLVPDWPVDKTQYKTALWNLGCFESPQLSPEDLHRVEMYTTERQRQTLKANVGSVDDWLSTLDITVTVEGLTDVNLRRAVQLLNKTNQLNLRTRRVVESDLRNWAAEEMRCLWTFSVSDRFGASGLTGIISLSLDGSTAFIEDFVLSCRVMGRRVEESMLHVACRFAGEHAKQLVAAYVPTAKNVLCLEFFNRSGLKANATGDTFTWDLRDEYPPPACVKIVYV
jgi:FkbH-like protein